jgi:hypothetical protein
MIQWIRNLQDWYVKVFGSIDDVDPDRVYNMDETPMNPEDMPRSDRISTAYREFIKCVTCVSASGKVMRPMLIFEGKNVTSRWIPSKKDLPVEVMVRASP